MSEDKTKITPKINEGQVRQAYEGYQKKKLETWKTKKEATLPEVIDTGSVDEKGEKIYRLEYPKEDNRTEEQKAFDTYAVQNGFTSVIVNKSETGGRNEKELNDWTKRIEDGPISHQIYLADKYVNSLNEGDKVIVFLKKGCIKDYPDKTLTIYGYVRSLSKSTKSMMFL